MSSQPQAINDDLDLDALTIQQARKYAALYRLPVSKDSTLEEIKALINKKRSSNDMAHIVEENIDTGPKPGWARITLLRDSSNATSTQPLYVNANGYQVTIPRGVQVDVPIKVVQVLNDAVELRLIETDPDKYEWQKVLCYPFTVHATTPGPDPRPGFEVGKRAAMRPREKFRERFGYWPSKTELLEAQKEGLIPLKD